MTFVVIAICYGLDGLEFETRWGQDVCSLPYQPKPGLGPTQPSTTDTGAFFFGWSSGSEALTNQPINDEVKMGILPLCLLWHVLGWNARSSLCFKERSKNCENQLLASSCLSVCLNVCLSACNNSAPTGLIFMKFDTWSFFRKLSIKFNFLLKYDNNNEYYTRISMEIYDTITSNSS